MSSSPDPQWPLRPDNDVPLLQGQQASVLGCLALPGEAIIQGRLEGEIKDDGVLVSRGGTTSGTIIATVVTVECEALDVLICAESVVLRYGTTGTGAIGHKELALEAGHLFEGKNRLMRTQEAWHLSRLQARSLRNLSTNKLPIYLKVVSQA